MSVQDGTQTGSLDLSRFDAENFSRHSESIDTQAMIAEETCASYALLSPKIMADFSKRTPHPDRKEARGSIANAMEAGDWREA